MIEKGDGQTAGMTEKRVDQVVERRLFEHSLEVMFYSGGYRHRALDGKSQKLIPARPRLSALKEEDLHLEAYRIASNLLLHLSSADIKDQSGLLLKLEKYAVRQGILLCLIPADTEREGFPTLYGHNIKTYEFEGESYAVVVGELTSNYVGIGVYVRKNKPESEADQLWYPLCKEA